MRKFVKPGGPVTGPGGAATPGWNDYFDGIAHVTQRVNAAGELTKLDGDTTAANLSAKIDAIIEALKGS